MARTRRVVLAALAVTALTLPALPAPAQAAAAALHDGRIAYARAGDIWSVRPDGTGATRLTSTGRDSQPRWSQDGSRLAFVRTTKGVADLWVSAADGSGARQVTSIGGTGRPDWSPDGSSLAFTAPVSGGRGLFHVDGVDDSGVQTAHLYYGSSDGSSTPLPVTGAAGGVSWSPDGSRIAFLSGEPSYCGGGQDPCVFSLDLQTQYVDELATALGDPDFDVFFLAVDWAPDSRHVAITQQLKGRARPPVVFLGTQFMGPAAQGTNGVVSPSGARAALTRTVDGVRHVFTLNSDGSGVRELVRGDTPDWQPRP